MSAHALAVATSVFLLLPGCGGGGAGANGSLIPGIGSSVPALTANQAYVGPQMSTLRYSHTATVLNNGDVLVVGGTDERHLTALSEYELFVQDAAVPFGAPTPETIRGDFIDQTIDGDLMDLPGGTGRFWHTANRLSQNRVLVIGGTTGMLFGVPNAESLIYDPVTRTFDEPNLIIDPADDINIPRVRHTTTMLPSGDLLIAGGQRFDNVFVPPNTNQAAYASMNDCEIFDTGTLTFSFATDSFMNPVTLTNTRGRAGHAAVRLGGFDELLGNSDDLVMFTGGYETPSPASLVAPTNLQPWDADTTKLSSIDFYFEQTQTMSFATGISLSPRVNHPVALNLGEERRQTPFNEIGMTNVILIFGGDSDEPCPQGAAPGGIGTTDRSELVAVTYSGFGPANGATFRKIAGTDMMNPVSGITSNTFDHGHEILMNDLAGALGCTNFNRSATDGVIMEIPREYDNGRTASIVFVAGGIDVTQAGGCTETVASICGANEIGGYVIYDPFWDPSRIGTLLPLNADSDGDGDADLFGWDVTDDISFQNPTGTTGSWLSLDTLLPGPDESGYADGATINVASTLAMRQPRAFHTVDRIAGENGIVGDSDDRVIIIGGAQSYYPFYGGAASSISCEIYVPPGAGN